MSIFTDNNPNLTSTDSLSEVGVPLTIVGQDVNCNIYIQRASDVNGEPGNFANLFAWAAGNWTYPTFDWFDTIYVTNGNYYWYRVGHSKGSSVVPTRWSEPIRAQARIISDVPEETSTVDLANPANTNAEYISPLYLEGEGDVQYVNGANIESGSFELTSADAIFRFRDVSKSIAIKGAGPSGVSLVTSIAEVITRETCSLKDPASTTVVDSPVRWGTDSTKAIKKAIELASGSLVYPKKVRLGPGKWWVSGSADEPAIQMVDDVTLFGDGPSTELILIGPSSGPIIANSQSVNRNFMIRDMVLNGDKDFHDAAGPGSTGY